MLYACCTASLLLLCACGPPAVDAGSEQRMRESLRFVRMQLEAGQREEFDRALRDLDDMLFNSSDALSSATISRMRPGALKRKILHGKTAREIIAMVDKHRRPVK